MILACHHITKEFPERTVLSDVTFHLEKGDKAAVVGANGAGKTTLLRIITGEMTPEEGTVTVSRDTTLGYLAQNQEFSSESTIYEELLSVKKDLVDMERELTRKEALMATVKGQALTELVTDYTDLMAKFERENGFTYKGEIVGVLRGLGFDDSEFEQKVSTLSGGQKTRVSLGKLLLSHPDIILLDEPTNHLDMSSIRWLETYLINYRGTVVLVSHDRYFLDRTVNKVLEIENGRTLLFNGNYTAYSERKQKLREAARAAYLNNQAEIRHQEEVIEKLRRFNREKSIRRAESREKMLQRMEVVEKPVELRTDMNLAFTPCIKSGREVLQVEGLSKSFDGKQLFSGLSFKIRRGEHVALIGDNGTGKTTILRMINGLVAPDSGFIRPGTNVHIGYYDQEHHVLTDSNTVFEEISDEYPSMTNTAVRNVLASFLFTGEEVFKLIGDLSGGEKGRVSLAKLMLSKANFLILDEPTNHLDIVSKEVLEQALNQYEGTVLYVSHDRYFINRTASRILNLTGNVLLNYPGNNEEKAPERFIGNYDYYLEKSAEIGDAILEQAKRDSGLSQAPEKSAAKEAAGSSREEWQRLKEEQAAARKIKNDLRKCEEEIALLEEESASLDEKISLPENSSDHAKLTALANEKETVSAKLAGLYEKWEILSEAALSLPE